MFKHPATLRPTRPVPLLVLSGEACQDRNLYLQNQSDSLLVVIPSGVSPPPWLKPGTQTVCLPPGNPYLDTLLANAETVFCANPSVCSRTEPAFGKQVPSPQSSAEKFAIAVVCDRKYLPFFFGLVQNLRAVHPGPLEIHLAALDAEVGAAAIARFPDLDLRVYAAEDLWDKDDLPRFLARSVASRAYTCKPRIALHALKNTEADAIFLLDLDIFFFRDPARLLSAFEGANALLFPQWSDRFTWARLHGSINSGMVGAKKGAEHLLAWWSQACLIRCDLHVEQGFFGDQGFLDQALVYFSGIRVYREWDEDVAPWNRNTLRAQFSDSHLSVLNGQAVGSFHAAGPDSDRVFELKYLWDQVVAVFSGLPIRDCPVFFPYLLEQQRLYFSGLDRAMRVATLLKNRLGIPVPRWTPKTLAWALGALSPLFSLIDTLHCNYARWRQHGPVEDPHSSQWVRLQQTVLFSPEKLLS